MKIKRQSSHGNQTTVTSPQLRYMSHLLAPRLANNEHTQRFLERCAEWIETGNHIYLLHRILHFGFDPTMIDSPLVKQRPLMHDPNWPLPECTEDPFDPFDRFFVEYMACLVKDNPGETKWSQS